MMNENYNTPNSGCCGRNFPTAPENKCNYNDCCMNEYAYKQKACIRNKQPDCEAQAVIPSITVETVDGITNLANCFVHVSSTNTTYYVDDKHRIMITWAGPVNIPGYDMDGNPNHYKNQIVTDTENETAVIYDNHGKGYIFGITLENLQQAVNDKLDAMAEDGTLQRLLQARDFADVPVLYFQTLFLKSRFIDGMEDMNGGCVLPDNSVIQCTGNNTFYHYAADGALLNSNTISGTGHCNGCCYNPKTGKVYIVSSGSGLDNRIMVMNPLTLTIDETIDAANRGYPAGAYGIVYNEQADEYIMTKWWGNGVTPYIWRVDSNFDLIQTETYDFYDINSTSNIGKFGNYVGVNNMYTHQILLFNMNDLSYYKTVKIDSLVSDTWTITEEEWFDTRADGKIMLGFHASGSANPHAINTGTYVYAIFDPTKNYEQCPIKDTYPPKNEFYYIDHTYTGNDRNGEVNTPFNNVYEALNSSLRTKRCTGKVTFRFSNNTETIYTPVFTMNKSYTIWNPNRTINFFGAIAVNNGCSVYCDRPIQLQLLENKINPFNSRGADIHCFGKMDLVGGLSTVNNVTPTIVGAGDFIAQFESCGLDVENFYGNVTCTGNALNTDVANVIKNSRNTYDQAKFSKEYKGIKGFVVKNSDDEYIVPPLSKTIMVVPQVKLGNNTYEPATIWNPNTFSSVCLYDGTAGSKLNVSVNANGRVSLYPSSLDATIIRVKIVSL